MTSVQIHCFLSAAKNGSLAKAAKELFFSTQVVSQHIQNLETELGVKLFSRNRDGVSVTEEGTLFHDFAVRWTGLYNQTIQTIQATYQNMTMHFNIGLSEFVDPLGPISGALVSFCQKHGSTNITGDYLSNQELLRRIQSGELDVAIMPDSQVISGGDYLVTPIAAEDIHLYIANFLDRETCAATPRKQLLEMCQQLPHINVSYGPWVDAQWDHVSRRMCAALGITFPNHVALPNYRSIVACASQIPCTVVSDARFGLMREQTDAYHFSLGIDSHICCVWSKRSEHPLLPLFVNHMQDSLKQE